MKEMEELLGRVRSAGAPEPPDVRYTVAVIRQRLGKADRKKEPEWPLVVAAVCPLVALMFYFGPSVWWLAGLLLAAACMTPILLRKGV